MSSAADARRAVAAGARAVLVGEALVRADNPAALIRELKAIPIGSWRSAFGPYPGHNPSAKRRTPNAKRQTPHRE
jgi:thiazole synthase ThiGH ThiG subunit